MIEKVSTCEAKQDFQAGLRQEGREAARDFSGGVWGSQLKA